MNPTFTAAPATTMKAIVQDKYRLTARSQAPRD